MNTVNEREQSDIEALLPWHAAGTLSRRDAQRVDAALAGDAELARRYELVREELGATIQLNETLGAPSARALQALFAKIDAEPARRQAPSLHLGARVAEFFAGLSPRTLAWSASAAALAIVLQAGLIADIALKDRSTGDYETASAPTRGLSGGSYALIRFQPEASAADITRFLRSNKLNVEGGPSVGGLYRVRIADAGVPKAERSRIVQTLQEDKVVAFIVTTE
jgi:anti-sigma factor RsiW